MKKSIIIILLIFGIVPSAQAAGVLFPVQGGTGISTIPTYGQMLVGNSSGTYTLTATSSLGISGTSVGQAWELFTNIFSVSALHPTTTVPIAVESSATSTFAGGLEVFTKIASPYVMATSTTATSTFFGGIQINGGLTVASLSGFLKATAGVVSTALVNLASDITGTLGIGNGGTNSTSQSTNGINYFNGTSIVSNASLISFDGTKLTTGYASTTAFTASGAGYLGSVSVGTTTTASELTIDGSGEVIFRLYNSVLAQQGHFGFHSDSSPSLDIGVTGNFPLSLETNDTSRIYITGGGNVGIGSTTPLYKLSIEGISSLGNQARAGYFIATTTTASTFNNASSTQFSAASETLYIDSNGRVQAKDTTNAWSGVVSPTRSFVLTSGTTTTWTASTTGSAYSPFLVMPFAGTLRQARCSVDSFLGVNVTIGGSNVTPSYFVASSTVGVEKFTAGNTFTAGQKILANVGTTTTATATSISCTFDVTETY